MKNWKEFIAGLILFSLTVVGCGNQNTNLGDLQLAAPEEDEIQSLLFREAQVGTCAEQNLLTTQAASIKPMIDPGNGETDPNADINFWISEMKVETNYEVYPPVGDIFYTFVYFNDINNAMIGILKISYEWDGEKWNQVGYQIECKLDANGTIRGQVVNALSGALLEGAVIYAESECGLRSPVSYSNPLGHFWVYGMIPGKVTLRIYAPGFEDVTIPGLEVQAGQTLNLEYSIQMVPLVDQTFVTVTGRIFFRDGTTPFSGVNLFGEAHATIAYLGNGSSSSGLPGVVDNEGNFRIPFVPRGEYQLRFASQALNTFIDENGNRAEFITVMISKTDGPRVELEDLRVDNMPPVIAGMESSAATIGPGLSANILTIASDPDNDFLKYHWKTSGGILSSTESHEIEWQAPEASGTYTIEVIANDDKGGADFGSIQITVAEPM